VLVPAGVLAPGEPTVVRRDVVAADVIVGVALRAAVGVEHDGRRPARLRPTLRDPVVAPGDAPGDVRERTVLDRRVHLVRDDAPPHLVHDRVV